MKNQILWVKQVSKAIETAQAEHKLIFIDFYRLNCEACMRMERGAFLDEDLVDYINKYFVSLKFQSGIDAEQFYRFNVTVEPAFIVLDAGGNEVYRKIGYFEPDLLIKQLEKAGKKAAHGTGG